MEFGFITNHKQYYTFLLLTAGNCQQEGSFSKMLFSDLSEQILWRKYMLFILGFLFHGFSIMKNIFKWKLVIVKASLGFILWNHLGFILWNHLAISVFPFECITERKLNLIFFIFFIFNECIVVWSMKTTISIAVLPSFRLLNSRLHFSCYFYLWLSFLKGIFNKLLIQLAVDICHIFSHSFSFIRRL